jgi:hypothetical protein
MFLPIRILVSEDSALLEQWRCGCCKSGTLDAPDAVEVALRLIAELISSSGSNCSQGLQIRFHAPRDSAAGRFLPSIRAVPFPREIRG